VAYLGEFEQLILFALLRLNDEAYGVSIRAEIEARTGRTVSSGAIYTALGRLENRGYVTSRVGEATSSRGGRRRKYYTLEQVGALALHDTYSTVREMARGLVPRLAGVAGIGDRSAPE
jgi:PadR family transcriptional regulator PadR